MLNAGEQCSSQTASKATGVLLTKDNQEKPRILVVEDVHETRYGMEKLLTADGYRVSLARDEKDAVENVQLRRPDLILVSLPGLPNDVILAATRIRDGADGLQVPVVIFCVKGIGEGTKLPSDKTSISRSPITSIS